MKKNILKNNSGFTLVELMVALGLFSLLLLMTVGGFVRSLRTERQTSAFTFVNNSLSIAIEQMGKEIRTGRNFCASGTSCQSSSVLSFLSAKGTIITYCLDGDAIKRNAGSDCTSGKKITGDNVNVQYLAFLISNNQGNNGWPPRVTILVGANSKKQMPASYNINLQTTVSSRSLAGLR